MHLHGSMLPLKWIYHLDILLLTAISVSKSHCNFYTPSRLLNIRFVLHSLSHWKLLNKKLSIPSFCDRIHSSNSEFQNQTVTLCRTEQSLSVLGKFHSILSFLHIRSKFFKSSACFYIRLYSYRGWEIGRWILIQYPKNTSITKCRDFLNFIFNLRSIETN